MSKVHLVLFLLVCRMCPAASDRFVHTQGKKLVDAGGGELHLRGINLGNWLVQEGYMFQLTKGPQSAREIEELVDELVGPTDAKKFWHSYRENYITEADIKFLRQQGFNSIRIPFHYRFFEGGNEEGFRLLDRVVQWSHDAGLYVILDMHCAPGGQTGANIDDSWGYPWLYEDDVSQNDVAEIWKRIAEHYRNNPTILGYDLLNEPIPHYPQLQKYNSALEPLYKRITASIRSVDKNHVIILEGAQWAGNFKVFGPPFDSNLMYSLHKYWMPPVQDALADTIAFRDRYDVPLWLGESGENNDEWIKQFAGLLEKNDIGWAFWPYKKMAATSSPVSFDAPKHWSEIVAFAQTRTGTGASEAAIARRPSIEVSREALAELLENVRFERCHINDGYLKALGLKGS
jgi:endoglucanase